MAQSNHSDDVTVESSTAGGVCHITLNRPNRLNAMTIASFDTLRRRLLEAALDQTVSCVVLTGKGRAFCAGQDLNEMTAPVMPDDGERHGFLPCIEEVERFPKPLIAAVNGLAVGFGATVLLHCDVVLMSTEARIKLPFAALGLAPEAGSSVLLPATIGRQAAAHLLFTGSWADASQCASLGLAWKAVPGQELAAATSAVASEIARMPLDSLTATKQLLLADRLPAVRSGRLREIEVFARLLGGPANQEALAAFAERRDADFSKVTPTQPSIW